MRQKLFCAKEFQKEFTNFEISSHSELYLHLQLFVFYQNVQIEQWLLDSQTDFFFPPLVKNVIIFRYKFDFLR